MPRIYVNDAELFYTDTGVGAETIIFSHGLLMSSEMFTEQIAYFSKKYRCIAYDHRGQASSEVTADGYDMATLTDDASALINALGIGPCHFVGLSMGGFVGMRLALNKPELLKTLTLLNTSSDAEPKENAKSYKS